MARARYQVLVIPYCITDGQVRFCVFRRKDLDIWQFIAGGGEDEDASIIESARREAFEEAGIPVTCSYSPLDTCFRIPADCFRDAEALWGQDCFVVPEYAFAVKVENTSLQLSREHTEYEWAAYACAYAMLQYDSNRTATKRRTSKRPPSIFLPKTVQNAPLHSLLQSIGCSFGPF